MTARAFTSLLPLLTAALVTHDVLLALRGKDEAEPDEDHRAGVDQLIQPRTPSPTMAWPPQADHRPGTLSLALLLPPAVLQSDAKFRLCGAKMR